MEAEMTEVIDRKLAVEPEGAAFPGSRKVYVEGSRPDIRVPFREVSLTSPAAPVRLYDTGGPHTDAAISVDPHLGLGQLRSAWIIERGDTVAVAGARDGVRRAHAGAAVTQLRYARRGEVTPEMEYIAIREGLAAELVRDEVARGRAIIPANINHPEAEPMIIGSRFLVKVNANIGNSAVVSSIDAEVEKMRWAT